MQSKGRSALARCFHFIKMLTIIVVMVMMVMMMMIIVVVVVMMMMIIVAVMGLMMIILPSDDDDYDGQVHPKDVVSHIKSLEGSVPVKNKKVTLLLTQNCACFVKSVTVREQKW